MDILAAFNETNQCVDEIKKLEKAREPYFNRLSEIKYQFREENKPTWLLDREFTLVNYKPDSDSPYYESPAGLWGYCDPKDIKKYLERGELIAKCNLISGVKANMVGKKAKVDYIHFSGFTNPDEGEIQIHWELTVRFQNKTGEWSKETYRYRYVDIVKI